MKLGIVPNHWLKYKVKHLMSLSSWVIDFAARLQQLMLISSCGDISNLTVPINIGALFSPEAFITATRQSVAQKNKWSLEELHLFLVLDRNNVDNSYNLQGKTNHSFP